MGFEPEFRPDDSKPAPNQTENGERVRNLLRGREALPAQPETGFQHLQKSGSSTAGNHVMASRGRLTTRFTGDSTRDLTLES